MAAGPWLVFDAFLDEKNSATHDLSTGNADVYKVALYDELYVPDLAVDTIYSVTNEVSATDTGYVTGGQIEVVSLDTTVAGEVTIDIVSPGWIAGTANLVCGTALIYNSSKSNKVVAYSQLDNAIPGTPANVTTLNGITLTLNTDSGVYTESRA